LNLEADAAFIEGFLISLQLSTAAFVGRSQKPLLASIHGSCC
jgi:hypothetical protein